jgi:hypothetical protein
VHDADDQEVTRKAVASGDDTDGEGAGTCNDYENDSSVDEGYASDATKD